MSGVASDRLPADQLRKILSAALERLHVQLTSPPKVQVGAPVTASIVGAGLELDVSDLLDGVLSLSGLAYTDADLGNVTSTATSLANLTSLVGSAVPGAGGSPLPGGITATPKGVLARLLGVASIPQLRVRVDIQWHLSDSHGRRLIEGEDFVAPKGLGLPDVLLYIPPLFQSLNSLDPHGSHPIARPAFCTYSLSVHVALSVGPVAVEADLPPKRTLGGRSQSVVVDIPERAHDPDLLEEGEALGIPLLVMPLLLPTALVLFSNPEFNPYDPAPAKTLVVVPHRSPIASLEQLSGVLRKIDQAVSDLRQLPFFAASLVGIDLLSSALSGQPGARLVQARPRQDGGDIPQGVADFYQIQYYSEPTRLWWIKLGTANVTFDNVAQSALLLGMPGTRVVFYNNLNFADDEGVWAISIEDLADFSVTTDPSTYRLLNILPFVIVRSMGLCAPPGGPGTKPNPDFVPDAPETIPPNRSQVVAQMHISWACNMSSVEFASLGTPPGCDAPPGPVIR